VAVQLQKNLDRVRLKRVASKSKNGTLGGYLISSHPSGLLIATKQLYVLCSFIEFQDLYEMIKSSHDASSIQHAFTQHASSKHVYSQHASSQHTYPRTS
jgi:hypothetical protein